MVSCTMPYLILMIGLWRAVMRHEQIELELKLRNMCFICHEQLNEQGNCPICSDPDTYHTWNDIVADEIEHQNTKRLVRL